MKSVSPTPVFSGGVQAGRVHRPRRDIENEEIQMYLSKLKDLVPFMPKNRKLSKLEVIQYVIDYICELQYALDTHPSVNSAVVQASAAALMRQAMPLQSSTPQTSPRQPLGVLAPNTILSAPTCSSPEPASTVRFMLYFTNLSYRLINTIKPTKHIIITFNIFATGLLKFITKTSKFLTL